MTTKTEPMKGWIALRSSRSYKARVQRAADHLGQTVATFTRRALDKQVEIVEQDMAKQEKEVA